MPRTAFIIIFVWVAAAAVVANATLEGGRRAELEMSMAAYGTYAPHLWNGLTTALSPEQAADVDFMATRVVLLNDLMRAQIKPCEALRRVLLTLGGNGAVASAIAGKQRCVADGGDMVIELQALRRFLGGAHAVNQMASMLTYAEESAASANEKLLATLYQSAEEGLAYAQTDPTAFASVELQWLMMKTQEALKKKKKRDADM